MYCRKLDVKIIHDWNDTLALTKRLLKLKDNAPSTYPFGACTHYDLKTIGQISQHDISESWDRLSSPAVNRTMPWLAGFLESMRELGPDDSSVGRMIGAGAGHIDFPHLRSALNFIIKNTDADAYTWIDSEIGRETYPSIEGTCWLLDTQKTHGIENTGERWALSIHFNADYEVVSKWFDNNTGLILGNK